MMSVIMISLMIMIFFNVVVVIIPLHLLLLLQLFIGQCLLDGEYVPETTVFCEKQVGCRAIQKTGHCCPDYKCGKLRSILLSLSL